MISTIYLPRCLWVDSLSSSLVLGLFYIFSQSKFWPPPFISKASHSLTESHPYHPSPTYKVKTFSKILTIRETPSFNLGTNSTFHAGNSAFTLSCSQYHRHHVSDIPGLDPARPRQEPHSTMLSLSLERVRRELFRKPSRPIWLPQHGVPMAQTLSSNDGSRSRSRSSPRGHRGQQQQYATTDYGDCNERDFTRRQPRLPGEYHTRVSIRQWTACAAAPWPDS